MDKISDSSELLNDLIPSDATDPMQALQDAIKHRDSCKLDVCPLCAVFRKHEQKRRDERWGWGRSKRVDERLNITAMISGKVGEDRKFEYVSSHDGMLRIAITSMTVSLLNHAKEDGDAVTIFGWICGSKPVWEKLENQPASVFVHHPLTDGIGIGNLHKGDRLAFTARFKEAATLSVNFWCLYGAARR